MLVILCTLCHSKSFDFIHTKAQTILPFHCITFANFTTNVMVYEHVVCLFFVEVLRKVFDGLCFELIVLRLQ